MANDRLSEIYRQHNTEQHKYTYFMLAAAVSAIGFAVQQTNGMELSWSMIPVGAAVLFWGVSFYCGAQNRLWEQSTLFANFNMLQLESGTHEDQPSNPMLAKAAIQGIREAMSSTAAKAYSYGIWQFRLLVIGGLCYLIWHIIKLAI